MKNNKEQIAKVRAMVAQLRHDLLMDKWSIEVRFENKNEKMHDGLKVAACVTPTPQYFTAIMNVYPYFFEMTGGADDNMFEALTHEMVHCITHEMFQLARDRFATPPELTRANERLTQHITRLVRWRHEPTRFNKANQQTNASRNKRKKTEGDNNRMSKKRDRISG